MGYTPNYGGMGPPNPSHAATFDPLLARFDWLTLGSARGDYEWRVSATNDWGFDEGRIIVSILPLDVPELDTFRLLGIAVMGLLNLVRYRGRAGTRHDSRETVY